MQLEKKGIKKNEENPQEIQGSMKRKIVKLLISKRDLRRTNWVQSIFKEILAEKFPTLKNYLVTGKSRATSHIQLSQVYSQDI